MKRAWIIAAIIILVAIHTTAAAPAVTLLDNANGGTWKEYIHIPIQTPTTTNAQYIIEINGTNVSVYNSTGALKVTGSCPSFWSYVNASGADIRVTNQSDELYFWIQKIDPVTKQAKIWVNLSAGSAELDIFYGNPNALPSVYDNSSKVFEFYDDFTKGLVGTWTQVTGTWSVGTNGLYVSTDYGVAPGNIITYTGRTFTAGEYVAYLYVTAGDREGSVIQNMQSAAKTSLFDIAGYTYNLGGIYINEWSGAAWGTGAISPLTASVGDKIMIQSYQIGSTIYCYIKDFTSGSSGTASYTVTPAAGTAGYIGIHAGAGYTTPFTFQLLFIASLADPATFGTPTQQPVGKPVPSTVYINATYNAYDITGHLLINNSTALLTPTFTYIPSTASSTGYLGTGSLTVPGLANITIYLDENYTLNTVVCNGTSVTPTYLGNTTINGIVFNVYNFTSPSAGLLVVTANVTPVTASGDTPAIIMGFTPAFNITSSISLTNVNATYGATIKVSVEQPLTLESLVYNGTALTIPTPTTELINGKNYSVYTVTVYNSSSLIVTAEAQNVLYNTVRLYADGNENFTYLLVGEPFKVVSPIPCNITLEGVTYPNATTASYTPMSTVKVIGMLYLFNVSAPQFGYNTFSVPVVWGHINLTITPQIPSTVGVYSITYSKVSSTNRLYAGENKITVYYQGMLVASKEFYLNHTNNGMNITMYVNATNLSCKCYNLTIVSNSKFNVTNLHPTIPYGKFAVNHTGEVIIQFCNNSPVTVTVTGNDYSYYPPYLYIYGSGNATVTPYYKMKLTSVSALGIPLSVDVKINGTKVTAYGTTDKVMPVNVYVVEFPSDVNGFILKNTNLTKTVVNLTTNTELPPAEYKVPTHISLEAYKINTTSFKFPFPIPFLPLGHITTKQVGQEAYISGTLFNWYDSPVPNANVTVKIVSLKTGYTIEKTVNTGNTGTFDVYFNVTPGVNYSITAVYNGSPVYVGSTEKIVVAGGALPPAPQKGISISTVMVLALTITVVCAGVAAVAYYAHKKRTTKAMIEMEKKARFFRRVK